MSLRIVLLALAIYAGVGIVVALALRVALPEQLQSLWWLPHALALASVGFLWGRGGDKWSMVVLLVMAPFGNAFREVKPWPLGLLAAAGMFAALIVGYGVGLLSGRRHRLRNADTRTHDNSDT